MAEWHTLDSARDQWDDAPLDDDYLQELLDVAKDAVLTYGHALTEEEAVPTRYRVAQLMQARNIFNASKASAGGDLDGSSFGISTAPLDWQVKQLIRPRSLFGGPVG